MAVLVTGGAGYIGSHCVRQLERDGQEVIVIDNLSKGHKNAVKSSKLYIGDIRDSDFIDNVFELEKIDSVIHFAADSLVGESMELPLKYYRNNVYTSLCLLEAMTRHDVKFIVFSSTAATYGEPEKIPIQETDKTIPKNPYGETKLAIEKMLYWADNCNDLKYTVLRYFNASGADVDGDIGEDHTPESHLIPLVLKTAQGERDTITVFGKDYETKDGTCVRDYIHVSDLADAHLLALKKLKETKNSKTFNLGTGQGFSVNEIIEASEKVVGHSINKVIGEKRAGDPAKLIASSSNAKSYLGWNPKYEDINILIETAWKWHKNYPKGYNDK